MLAHQPVLVGFKRVTVLHQWFSFSTSGVVGVVFQVGFSLDVTGNKIQRPADLGGYGKAEAGGVFQ